MRCGPDFGNLDLLENLIRYVDHLPPHVKYEFLTTRGVDPKIYFRSGQLDLALRMYPPVVGSARTLVE